MALSACFVRHRGRRDHVYVRRSDGTRCDWTFPTYGERLPHDLCHLVVEGALGMANGFWGLVEQGMGVALVDNQGTLVREGRPLAEQADADLSDLLRAEEAVALFGPTGPTPEHSGDADPSSAAPGFALPAGMTPALVAALRQRLRELALRWRALDDDEAITLEFAPPPR